VIVKAVSLLVPSLAACGDIDNHILSAKTEFKNILSNGGFQSLESGMMVYRVSDNTKSHTGIILGVDISHFNDATIVHHENTIPTKVQHQVRLLEQIGGLVKPIVLTHRPLEKIKAIMHETTSVLPAVDIHLNKYQAKHQLWPISNPDHIREIESTYATINNAYIVDGHHRTAAIQAFGQSQSIDHGLCAMFDIEELDILPFHRVIHTNLSTTIILDKLHKISTLELLGKTPLPSQTGELTALIEGKAYRLKWNQNLLSKDLMQSLDVNLLSSHVLNDILGIASERDSKIKYVEGNHSAEKIFSSLQKGQIAFLLHPIAIQAFIQLVRAKAILPPKSTWFLPRMATGMVCMEF